MVQHSILIVDDDVHILHAAHLFLKRHFLKVDIEKNVSQLPYLLNHGKYDLILLDMNFCRNINTGDEGFHWLDYILDHNPEQKVILFTAFGDIDMAVRAIKNGAADFILKPWENDKLLSALKDILEINNQNTTFKSDLIGDCESMKDVMNMVRRVAPTDANILILGENGTGKDMLAREIHKQSSRSIKTFVHADLGSISESLFESELFGHVKGAFTDAREDRNGRFKEADGGTLFLDEIGNIPLTLQSKLLFALQNQSFVKVGSSKPVNFDARMICATNENIYKRVEEKTFRQDLLYRINTIEITMPPLRDRGEDIILLANHFLAVFNDKYRRKIKNLSAGFVKKLFTYHWPGNVRELRHVIERAVILTTGATVSEETFEKKSGSASGTLQISSFQLDELERETITKTLKRFNGNITDASKELGISRQALYRRIEKYGL